MSSKADDAMKKVEYHPWFLEFWDVYPRKAQKREAFMGWQKTGAPNDRKIADRLLRAAKAHKAKMQEEGRPENRICHARTFINQSRWEDYEDASEGDKPEEFFFGGKRIAS